MALGKQQELFCPQALSHPSQKQHLFFGRFMGKSALIRRIPYPYSIRKKDVKVFSLMGMMSGGWFLLVGIVDESWRNQIKNEIQERERK